MEIKRCPNGHHYDPEKYVTCPYCDHQKENQAFTFDRPAGAVSRTMPITSDYGKTEPVSGGFSADASNVTPQPMKTSAFLEKDEGFFPKTVPLDDREGRANVDKKVEEYDPTLPVGAMTPPKDMQFDPGVVFNPVTGWLVCVDGASKGTDYRIRGQYNYIGRAKHMDICIPGDEYISAEKAAILAYDDIEKKFFIAPGMGHNLVRLNGRMVMGSEMLNPYDKIVIGKTTLVFVPLCGEQFDWKDR